MENCYQGISIPEQQTEACGGDYKSTKCVLTERDLTSLEISAGDSQEKINASLETALLQKETQIQSLQTEVNLLKTIKIFKGSFLDGAFVETNIDTTTNGVFLANPLTGVYTLTCSEFSTSTTVVVTPNSVPSGYEDVIISYDFSDITSNKITFKVKNNGVLVNLLESPIKIEI